MYVSDFDVDSDFGLEMVEWIIQWNIFSLTGTRCRNTEHGTVYCNVHTPSSLKCVL